MHHKKSAQPYRVTLRSIATFALITSGLMLLTACAPPSERRSFGTVIDDQTLETKAMDAVYSLDEFDTADHVKVEVHNGTLLMAGEVKSEENKNLATEATTGIKGMKRVVNELHVGPAADTGDRMNNSYMTSKVNTVLTKENPVVGFDATRIKVLTARKIVYLMGTVTRAEAEAVAEVVRNVGGVEKVVKVFDYTD